MTDAAAQRTGFGRLDWAGYALGFGLGGFFDGILLHQILQWHHLLSGIATMRDDLSLLILWDGVFHVMMYVITGLGLWLLWRAKPTVAAPGAGRRLLGGALVGFGAWHLLDSVLSHWVLGLHRIRMDVADPLFWDLLWFTAFGLVPLVAGLLLRRRPPPERDTQLQTAPTALVLAVLVSGPLAALPAAPSNETLVVFAPGVPAQAAHQAMLELGGRLVWTDPAQKVWAMQLPQGTDGLALYRRGALLVAGSSFLPAGCFGWSTS
ncbi:MAG TPA: DUF2243 domain-containing protein [Devosiaceae bacterium]|jgi:uncharacterized membrane protein|nr:DUF2243 domain-containing protein [Devosiaceae bacterium]